MKRQLIEALKKMTLPMNPPVIDELMSPAGKFSKTFRSEMYTPTTKDLLEAEKYLNSIGINPLKSEWSIPQLMEIVGALDQGDQTKGNKIKEVVKKFQLGELEPEYLRRDIVEKLRRDQPKLLEDKGPSPYTEHPHPSDHPVDELARRRARNTAERLEEMGARNDRLRELGNASEYRRPLRVVEPFDPDKVQSYSGIPELDSDIHKTLRAKGVSGQTFSMDDIEEMIQEIRENAYRSNSADWEAANDFIIDDPPTTPGAGGPPIDDSPLSGDDRWKLIKEKNDLELLGKRNRTPEQAARLSKIKTDIQPVIDSARAELEAMTPEQRLQLQLDMEKNFPSNVDPVPDPPTTPGAGSPPIVDDPRKRAASNVTNIRPEPTGPVTQEARWLNTNEPKWYTNMLAKAKDAAERQAAIKIVPGPKVDPVRHYDELRTADKVNRLGSGSKTPKPRGRFTKLLGPLGAAIDTGFAATDLYDIYKDRGAQPPLTDEEKSQRTWDLIKDFTTGGLYSGRNISEALRDEELAGGFVDAGPSVRALYKKSGDPTTRQEALEADLTDEELAGVRQRIGDDEAAEKMELRSKSNKMLGLEDDSLIAAAEARAGRYNVSPKTNVEFGELEQLEEDVWDEEEENEALESMGISWGEVLN